MVNLKGISVAFNTYAAAWNDYCPNPPSKATLKSLCDQTAETRTALMPYLPTPNYYYCPGNPAQDPAKLWATGPISTWGYVLFNDRGTAGSALPATLPTHKPPLQYATRLFDIKSPRDSILALDVIVTDSDAPPFNYSPAAAAVPFGTSHYAGSSPITANIVYLDGHVEFQKFDPKTALSIKQPAGGFFWIP